MAEVAGDSYVCPNCNAMIGRNRAEMHSTMWCPALSPRDME